MRPSSENLSQNVVLPYGEMALARPVCGGPDGTSALWPVPKAERSPGPRGGETVLPGPALTRLAACPWGTLWPGFSNSMPGSSAFQREISYVLDRERHLAGRAAVSAVFRLAETKPYAGSQPGSP